VLDIENSPKTVSQLLIRSLILAHLRCKKIAAASLSPYLLVISKDDKPVNRSFIPTHQYTVSHKNKPT